MPGGALPFWRTAGSTRVKGAGLSLPAKDPVTRVSTSSAHGPVTVKRARTDTSAGGSDHLPVVVEVGAGLLGGVFLVLAA